MPLHLPWEKPQPQSPKVERQQHRTANTPKGIATLQGDVLSSIFEAAIRQCWARPSLRESPLNLSQTCHSWREILLSNGRFWTKLHLVSVKSYDTRMVLTWLERSRDAPISIRLGYLHSSPGAQGRNGSQNLDLFNIVKVLIPHQARLSSFILDLHASLEEMPFPFTLSNLAEMTKLDFHHSFPFAVSKVETDVGGLGVPLFLLSIPPFPQQAIAPSLRKLIIARAMDEAAQQAGLIAMLRQCPNLQELHFSSRAPSDLRTVPSSFAKPEESTVVCLDSLEVLALNIIQYNYFLRLIRVPNLRHLRVEAMLQSTSSAVAKDVLSLLADKDSSASTTLRKAHLCFEQIEDEIRFKLLRAMPEITTLETNFVETKEAYDQLSLENTRNRLCPKLEKLDITVQPEDLAAMQQSLFSRFSRVEGFRAWVLIGNPGAHNNPRFEFPSPLRTYQTEGRLNGKRVSDHIGLCYPIVEWGWCGTGRIMQAQTIMRFNERGY